MQGKMGLLRGLQPMLQKQQDFKLYDKRVAAAPKNRKVAKITEKVVASSEFTA
jgi:hypothetical protein